jgi:hypothetical protein
VFAGPELAGPNGLPHGAIGKIAKRFSTPLTRRCAANRVQAALTASSGPAGFGFDLAAFRLGVLSRRSLVDWRFHRTTPASGF